MSQIISCTSQYSVGCTFLEWSINYLAGKTKYYHATKGWTELTKNPITKLNAHSHIKNHPNGLAETQQYIQTLQKNTDFVTLYPIAQHIESIADQHNIALENISAEHWNFLNQQQASEYNKLLKWLSSIGSKIIFVSLDPSLTLYSKLVRSTERIFYTRGSGSDKDAQRALDTVFFQKSIKKWSDLELTNVWDVRERMALDLRPFEHRRWSVEFNISHMWIDSQELWYNGKSKIFDIMNWLEVAVVTDRIDHWNTVFDQWQQLQLKNLKFQYQYQHIVDCIINGWSYPIDLTFDQEVIIQHCLIYQHNLNLKTWNLTKFPSNTKDLHALLEPNIHPIENIY